MSNQRNNHNRRKRKKSTRRQSAICSLMIVMVVFLVCIVSAVIVGRLHEKSRDLAITERSLEQQIEKAKLEHEDLVAQEQYMKTNDYIEDEAKAKLGLVYPDEIVIRPAEP